MERNNFYENWYKNWQESFKYDYPDGYFEKPIPIHELLKVKGRRPKTILDIDWVKPGERKALFWLAKTIHYDAMELMSLLGGVRRGRVHYCVHLQAKKNGKLRVIHEPSPELKKVQKKIAKHLLADLPIANNVFGFSCGGIRDAIRPHIKAKSWMMVDIKDAFPSVLRRYVENYLKFGYAKPAYCPAVAKIDGRLILMKERLAGPFSFVVSRALCDLCMLGNTLPQGAPTSPRLFDFIFSRMDYSFKWITENNKVTYTRYADNLFFSTNKKTFDKNLMWRLLEKFELISENDIVFDWHKLKVRHYTREAVRMLGLNIIGGKLHNRRVFKRRLRKHVAHLKWLKENNKDYASEYEKLMGMMGFAVKSTLPKKILKEIDYIKKHY